MLFDIENYNERVKSAMDFDKKYGLAKKFCGYDLKLKKIKDSLFSYESLHEFGIIPITADVFLLLPNSTVIVQKRSHSVDIPNTYGPSAGGHCEFDQSPKETAIIELTEELGLTISSDRLQNIFCNEKPIKNYFFRKQLCSNESTNIIQKFAPKSQWYSNKGIPIVNRVNVAPRNETKSHFFNQELAYFYFAFIDYKEQREIGFTENEIDSIEMLDIASFRSLINELKYSSDSLFLMSEYKICDLLQYV